MDDILSHRLHFLELEFLLVLVHEQKAIYIIYLFKHEKNMEMPRNNGTGLKFSREFSFTREQGRRKV